MHDALLQHNAIRRWPVDPISLNDLLQLCVCYMAVWTLAGVALGLSACDVTCRSVNISMKISNEYASKINNYY